MATHVLPPVPVGIRWEFHLLEGGPRYAADVHTNAMPFAILLLDRMAAAWGEGRVRFPTPIEEAAGLHDEELLDEDDHWPTPMCWQDPRLTGCVELPGGRRMEVIPMQYDHIVFAFEASEDVNGLDVVIEVLGVADARALRLPITLRDPDRGLVGYDLALTEGMPSVTLPTTFALTFVRRDMPLAVTLPAIPKDNPLI